VAGHGIQIAYQLLGVTVAGAWALFWTFIIFYAIDLTLGMRVSEEVERLGLGTLEHGEHADDYFYYQFNKYLRKHKDQEDKFGERRLSLGQFEEKPQQEDTSIAMNPLTSSKGKTGPKDPVSEHKGL